MLFIPLVSSAVMQPASVEMASSVNASTSNLCLNSSYRSDKITFVLVLARSSPRNLVECSFEMVHARR